MKQIHRRFDIDPEILKGQVVVETYRSRGPGGQHKNKSETAVRLTHPPSGITVVATEHRSQAQNKKLAFERLRERLRKLNQRAKPRIPTRVPRSVTEQRLQGKKRRAMKKRLRERPIRETD
jgi:ribosome-associated protein